MQDFTNNFFKYAGKENAHTTLFCGWVDDITRDIGLKTAHIPSPDSYMSKL